METKQSAGARLASAKRVVVKIGTNALTNSTGRFNREHFARLADDLVWTAQSRQLVVVSSGAIALGVERLGLAARPKDIPGKQACAAVGQSRLMQAYEDALGAGGKTVAQVLLTHDDVQDRRRYLNAKHVLQRLLDQGVIPVINENDTVSVDELKFGDNDSLAGLVAPMLEADVLVILSDVEGLFKEDPRKNPSAEMVSEVRTPLPEIMEMAGASSSEVGTGGMSTKVRAAARVAEQGGFCVIASGREPGALRAVLSGQTRGTVFWPQRTRRSARSAWIAHALFPKGRLVVDAGAVEAVRTHKKSLLPSGIERVEGIFGQGDPVDLVDSAGVPFARGLSAYSADELTRIARRKSSEIEQTLGYRYLDEAVHRDDLAMLESSDN